MVKAEIDIDVLHRQGVQDELIFIVKAAPANGKWNTQGKYTGYHVWQGFYPSGKLVMSAGIFLVPGAYTIATIVCDPVSGKRNLSLSRIQVPGPTTGEAAELLGELPEIDFLGARPVGSERFLLPVKTQRPIQFDLIVDLSTREESRRWDMPSPPYQAKGATNPSSTPDTERWPAIEKDPSKLTGTAQEQTREQSRLLEIASVLKELDFQPGCARVTALDVLRLRTLLPPTAANAVDWRQLGNENSAPDKVMVSVTSLEGRKDAGKFFQEQLRQTITQPPQCKLNSANPFHVIAILSHGIHFPSGSNKLKLEAACNCKLFYFYASGLYIGGGDDLKNMLKPLSPEVLTFSNSQAFRERLLEFAEAIKKASMNNSKLQ